MNEDRKCVLCGPQGLLAVFGILLGAVFILMSIDVLTNSALSSAIGQRRDSTVDELETVDD